MCGAFLASVICSDAANFMTFRDGVNGYAGTQDTFLAAYATTADNSSATTIEIDGPPESEEAHILLRFDNIFGSGTNQIPAKSKILYASLTIQITNTGNEPKMHRLLVPWKESESWESRIDGIVPDDIEAAVVEDLTFPGNGARTVIPLLVSTLQSWSDGTKTNYGWALLPGGTDGTDFTSSEHSTIEDRPMLTVVWGTVDEAFVKSVSPSNGGTSVPTDANISIVIADGGTQLNPNSVLLTVNGQSGKPVLDKPAGSSETTLLYDPPVNLPANAKIPIRLIYSDNATPAHVTTNDFSFTTRANTTTLFAIDDKQAWKYDRSGTDLGTAWKEKSFNDSAWPSGMALIAQEPSATAEPIRTEIERFNDAGDYVVTFYFRTHFNYTGPLGGNLILRHVVDDGAVFYLNGVEIHRFGLAAGAALDFTTSFGGHENAYEGPFIIPGTNLVSGDNVFAVEVHQSGTGSSDIVFGTELLVSTAPAPPAAAPKFTVFNRAGTNLSLEWTGTGTLESGDAVTGPWTGVANAKSPFSAALAGTIKFYRLK